MAEARGSEKAGAGGGDGREGREFVCGVVEGFYGRPWTTDHREELFKRMRKMGLGTYVYAPKDDLKHRAYWRDLYTQDEADKLQALIMAAEEEGREFVYALSPGIDITYSSPKENALIIAKLKQVWELGCRSFALLFDDIEPVMSEADQGRFGSFAEAQVAVTNGAHEALPGPPNLFLFCPTEYCESRAVPSLANSAYLNYVGTKLLPPIHVLWTGPRVISRILSPEHAKEVGRVLRRRPLIWDNLHANDYDHRRVFFGPYSGRPMALKPHIAGVLTNPNCEFEANYVALDSLAQWAKADADAAVPPEGANGATLEAGGEAGVASSVVAGAAPVVLYHPSEALRASLAAWLPEFSVRRSATGAALAKDPAPVTDLVLGINTCAPTSTLTTTTSVDGGSTTSTSSTPKPPSLPSMPPPAALPQDPGPLPIYTPPAVAATVVNPLVPPPLVSADTAELQAGAAPVDPLLSPALVALNSLSDTYGEPMELAGLAMRSIHGSTEQLMDQGGAGTPERAGSGAASGPSDTTSSGSNVTTTLSTSFPAPALPVTTTPSAAKPSLGPDNEEEMRETSRASSRSRGDEMDEGFGEEAPKTAVSLDDLRLLAELFYLPFQHGPQGVSLMREYAWLKLNSHVVRTANEEGSEALKGEWVRRAGLLSATLASLRRLYLRLVSCPNGSLVNDVYPYVWEMERVGGLVGSLVEWIGAGHLRRLASDPTGDEDEEQRAKSVGGGGGGGGGGEAAAQLSGESEPWVLRGGLIGELLQSFPIENPVEVIAVRAPQPMPSSLYRVRPYSEAFRERLADLAQDCLRDQGFFDKQAWARAAPAEATRLFVGAFVGLCPGQVFVAEKLEAEADEASDRPLVGVFLGFLDVHGSHKELQQFQDGLLGSLAFSGEAEAAEAAQWADVAGRWASAPPDPNGRAGVSSFVRLLTRQAHSSASRLLLGAGLSALKLNGSAGAYVERTAEDGDLLQWTGFHMVGGKVEAGEEAAAAAEAERYLVRWL